MNELRFQPDAIEQLPISALRAYARNPRTHSPDQIAKLAASLVEFGWTMPVLIDDANEVIAGHGRLAAAQSLGLTEVPAIRLKHLTSEQARAYRIADNKLALDAGWDEEMLAIEFHELTAAGFDLELTGFGQAELDALMAPFENDDGDDQSPVTLAERFGIPPFSVFNAREGWWQDRKRAWIDLGIQSELGRGQNGDADRATPGGHLMPATDYSKSGKRGDGRGRVIDGASA